MSLHKLSMWLLFTWAGEHAPALDHRPDCLHTLDERRVSPPRKGRQNSERNVSLAPAQPTDSRGERTLPVRHLRRLGEYGGAAVYTLRCEAPRGEVPRPWWTDWRDRKPIPESARPWYRPGPRLCNHTCEIPRRQPLAMCATLVRIVSLMSQVRDEDRHE